MYKVSSIVGTTATRSIGLRVFAWLTAPGIIVHETGHAIFCLLFGHKVKEFKWFDPQPDGTLGHVVHTWKKGSFYQGVGNFFIGTGPVWFGCLVVYLLSLLLMGGDFLYVAVSTPVSPADLASPGAVGSFIFTFLNHVRISLGNFAEPALLSSWKFWVFMYLTLCIGLHMKMSPSDMKGAWPGFLMFVGLVLVMNLGISIFVMAMPTTSLAATAASMTAVLAGLSLSVAGILAITIVPALAVMLVIDLFVLVFGLVR